MPAFLARLFSLTAILVAVLSAIAAEPATDLYGDPLPQGAVARLGTIRLRHDAAAIAFAPDGKTFASAGRDKMVRLWNAADGKEIRAFKGHTSQLTAVAFSPDGKKLYSSGIDFTLREWDVAEGKELRTLNNPTRLLYTALVVHPTEPLLLTAARGSVCEWDLKEGKPARTLAVPLNSIVALCPDGKHFAVYKDNAVSLRDFGDKEVQSFAVGTRRVSRLTFSADGSTLAAGCQDMSAVFWDVKTGHEIRAVPGSGGIGATLTLSANGRYYVAKSGNTVRVMGLASGQELRQFDVPNVYIGVFAFSPDSRHLVSAHSQSLLLWDLETSRPIHHFVGHTGYLTGLCFSADGKRLTSLGSEGTVIWWDPATGKSVLSWNNTGQFGFGTHLAPDGRTFYHTSINGLERYDLIDDKPVERPFVREMNLSTPCLAISADGKVLAVRLRGQLIHFLSADGARDLGHLALEHSRYSYYTFSPDGKQLVGGLGSQVHTWDVPSGTLARQFDLRWPNPNAGVASLTSLEYSPDGRSLLTGTIQGAILWELATGHVRWRTQPTSIINAVTFSPDGRLAAIANSNGTVSVLDTATGTALSDWSGHRATSRIMTFSADGTRLASGSDDGTVLVWNTTDLSKKVRPEPLKLTEAQLADLWNELGSLDSAKAYKALRTLAASPQAAAYLQANAKGGAKFDETHAKKLIVQLDDDDFDLREKATKDLAAMGPAVIPVLREALKGQPSVEVKKRIEELLAPFKDQQVPLERLRALRAVEALELSGSDDALKALKALSSGDAKEPLTLDAKTALERLERRKVKP